MRDKVVAYFDFWKTMVDWVDLYLNALSDDELRKEATAEGNHGIWLSGHLIASEDDLSEYLGKGLMLFPEYQKIFAQGSSLKSLESYPLASLLRTQWKEVCNKNRQIYLNFEDHEMGQLHEKIEGSPEDDYFKTKEACLRNWIFANA